MNKYYFEGERIKLTSKDYMRMHETYKNLDLTKELQQLDIELRDATDKQWFMTMNAKLNYRNKKAAKGVVRTRDIPIAKTLTDTSWADTGDFKQLTDDSWAN